MNRRVKWIAVSVLLSAGLLMPGAVGADLEIWFLWANGSSGTGTLIKGPDGTVVLFDEGGGATWASYAADLMDDEGITYIDYAVAGHYDGDHIRGLDDLNDELGGDSDAGDTSPFGVFYDRGGSLEHDGDDIDSNYYDLVEGSGKRATVLVDGSTDIDLGDGAVLQFLSVGAEDTDEELYIRDGTGVTSDISENNKSISCLVTYGGFDLYLGSDLEGAGEKAVDDVVVTTLGRSVDVLLVDHHGSDTNDISSAEFLGNMGPEVAVISVWSNGYGHPRYDTVTNLQAVVETDDERIIRLHPGDDDHADWADETMSYCHTTNSHLYITTDGCEYTVEAVALSDGSQNDITDADLSGHAVDEDCGEGGIDLGDLEIAFPFPLFCPVRINEIMANPHPFLTAAEFVELYNESGTVTVDVDGWEIYDGEDADAIVDYTGAHDLGLSGTEIPPGGYALIVPSNYNGAYNSVLSASADLSSLVMLTVDDTRLGDGLNNFTDSVTVTTDWRHPLAPLFSGVCQEETVTWTPMDGLYSMLNEDVSWEYDSDLDAWDFSAAASGSTPGFVNSCE